MRKALIIIAAVFAGLIALAVVGSLLPNEEPQAVLQPAAPSPALTEEEREVYDYIASATSDLDDLYGEFGEACSDVDLSAMVQCGRDWRTLSDEWDELPIAGGNVSDLEYAFDDAVWAVNKSMKDAIRILDGKDVSEEALKRHVTAAVTAIAACEAELEAVSTMASY